MSERELEVSGAEVVVAITTELAGKVLKNGESADVFLESVIKRVEEGDIQKVNERDDKTTPREHKVLNALAKKQDINLARLAAWAEIKKYKHIDVVAALVFPQPGKIEKDTKLTDKADFLAKAMRKIAQKQVGQKLTDEEIVKGFDVVGDMKDSLLQVALKAIKGVGQGVEEPLLEVEDVGEEVVDFEKDKIELQASKIKKLAEKMDNVSVMGRAYAYVSKLGSEKPFYNFEFLKGATDTKLLKAWLGKEISGDIVQSIANKVFPDDEKLAKSLEDIINIIGVFMQQPFTGSNLFKEDGQAISKVRLIDGKKDSVLGLALEAMEAGLTDKIESRKREKRLSSSDGVIIDEKRWDKEVMVAKKKRKPSMLWKPGRSRPKWGDKEVAKAVLEDYEMRVDLNTAPLDQITNLPEVGPAMAERIIEARPFSEVSGLSHITGIDSALLEKLKPLVGLRSGEEVYVGVKDGQIVAGKYNEYGKKSFNEGHPLVKIGSISIGDGLDVDVILERNDKLKDMRHQLGLNGSGQLGKDFFQKAKDGKLELDGFEVKVSDDQYLEIIRKSDQLKLTIVHNTRGRDPITQTGTADTIFINWASDNDKRPTSQNILNLMCEVGNLVIGEFKSSADKVDKSLLEFEPKSKVPVVKALDLNTAPIDEITNLPGVGPAMAKRIVVYRENTPFESADELLHIAGVGPALLERLTPLVGVKVEDKVDVKVEDVQTVAGEDKLSADKIVELPSLKEIEEVVPKLKENDFKVVEVKKGVDEEFLAVVIQKSKKPENWHDLYSTVCEVYLDVLRIDKGFKINPDEIMVRAETIEVPVFELMGGGDMANFTRTNVQVFELAGGVDMMDFIRTHVQRRVIGAVDQVGKDSTKALSQAKDALNKGINEARGFITELGLTVDEPKLKMFKDMCLLPEYDLVNMGTTGLEEMLRSSTSKVELPMSKPKTENVVIKSKFEEMEASTEIQTKEIELEFGGGIYSGKRPVDLTLYSDWQEFRNRVIVAQVKDGYGQGKGLRSILELDRTNIEINIDNPKSSGMASNILMRRELEFINKIDNLQDYLLYVNYGLDKNIFQQKYRDLMGFFKQTGWSDVNDLLSVEKAWERADKEIGQKIELELFDNAGNEKQGLYRSLLKVETVDNQVQISQGSLLIGEFGKQIGNFSLSTSNANICQFSRRGNKVIVGLTSNSSIYRNKAEVGVFIDLTSSQLKENFSQLKEELQTKLELVWGGEVEVRSEADSLFIIRDGRAFKFFTSPKINLRLAWDREKSTKKVVDNTGISQELFNDMLQITEVLVEMGLGKKVEDVETKRKEVVDDFNEVFKSLGVKATVLENGTIEVSGEIEGTFFTKDLKCINALQEVLDLSEVDEGDNVQKVILKHSVSCWRNLKVSKGVVFKRNLFLYKESVFDGGIVNDTLHANENMWFVDGTVGGAVHLGADSNAVIIEDEGKNDVEFGNSDKPALIKGNKLYIGNPNIIDIYGWILRDSRLVKDNIGDGKAFLEYDLQEVEVKEGQTVLKIGDDFVLVTKGDKKALLILQKDGNWDVRIMGGGREVVSKEDLKTALKEFDLTVEVGELF